MRTEHIPDIQQRDDANEIQQANLNWFERFCIRRAKFAILRLVSRRLEREAAVGRITDYQRDTIANVFRRVFHEDTNA